MRRMMRMRLKRSKGELATRGLNFLFISLSTFSLTRPVRFEYCFLFFDFPTGHFVVSFYMVFSMDLNIYA